MTAPDADHKPDAVTPEALAAGQRALAAIVFTDTVGFSALMSKDEEGTLRLVARDLDQMKTTCGAFGGQVLKSTGDGLLMLFNSAVQAVACALEIQREFHTRNVDLPKGDRLQHRIGIHLGDVFQNGGDVMGDGVNIAARLETQAIPGGICLSKTVYDVVHNRLPFYVNDLGPRKLKNIGTITAYQISPTDSGQRYINQALRWTKTGAVLVAFLGFVLLLFLVVYHTGVSRQRQADDELMKMARQLDPDPAAKLSAPPAKVAGQTSSPAETVTPPTGFQPAVGKIAASDEEFKIARYNYMNKYNFGAMCAWLEKYDAPSTDEDKLDEVCKSLRALFGWCTIELQNYSDRNPLKVRNEKDGRAYGYWADPAGGIMFRGDSGIIDLPREQVPPETMAAIAAQLIRENARPGQPSTVHLWRGVKYFVTTYHVKLSGDAEKELDELSDPSLAAADLK